MSVSKIAVFGSENAGRSTFLGNMMHKCDGFDLETIETLQKEGINRYDDIGRYLENRNIPMRFHIPARQQIEFIGSMTDQISGLLWVTTVEHPDFSIMSFAEADREIVKQLLDRNRVFILLNKMDLLQPSELIFQQAITDIKTHLEDEGFIIESEQFMLISALRGENLISVFDKRALNWDLNEKKSARSFSTVLEILERLAGDG